MARLTISAAATETLDVWLDQLMRGKLAIHRLPAPVAAFWFAAFAEGRASRDAEVARLEHEANLLYLEAFSPKDRAAEYQRRLDQFFAQQDAEFFAASTVPAFVERKAA